MLGVEFYTGLRSSCQLKGYSSHDHLRVEAVGRAVVLSSLVVLKSRGIAIPAISERE